jgi:hypothetical protein
VEGRLGRGHRHIRSTVVGVRVAFAEVVGLNLSVIAAKSFLYERSALIRTTSFISTYPVHFVQVVRLQDDTADNPGTRSRLHLDLRRTEEKVEIGLDGGGIAFLVDDELGTVGTICDRSGGHSPIIGGALGEVGKETRASQSFIGRTC